MGVKRTFEKYVFTGMGVGCDIESMWDNILICIRPVEQISADPIGVRTTSQGVRCFPPGLRDARSDCVQPARRMSGR